MGFLLLVLTKGNEGIIKNLFIIYLFFSGRENEPSEVDSTHTYKLLKFIGGHIIRSSIYFQLIHIAYILVNQNLS